MDSPLPITFDPLSEDETQAVRQALDVHAAHPAGSTPRQINKMMTKLSLAYPNAKLSVAEAEARLELYEEMLADIDVDVLATGFRAAVKTCKFFPSVSELREFAMAQPATPRMVQRYRLQVLLHHKPPAPAEPYATPEQIAEIKAELSEGAQALLDRIVGSQAA